MKYLSILGSTGSIGVNTLNIVRGNPERYRIIGLAAGENTTLLHEQICEFQPQSVAVKNEDIAGRLERLLTSFPRPDIYYGPQGYRNVAVADGVDMVVSAMSGAAGLLPSLAAIDAGKDVAIANKEVMVMAGEIVTARARVSGSRILPVDSEHSAVFQCLLGHRREDVKRIILTASGGPFLHLPKDELSRVTPSQALNHPNWQMGKKITIDSATMMNKGLEVIEARWLFDLDWEKIHIHIHPQSIVHSLVEYIDGSVLAQLGAPDMKVPIAYALSFPERTPVHGSTLDLLTAGTLNFLRPDWDKFPCIKLAYDAGRRGGTMPAVLNAANEIAVEAFIGGRICLTEITRVIEETLSFHTVTSGELTLEDVLAADRWAREWAGEAISRSQ